MARKSELDKLTESLLDSPWWLSLVVGGAAYGFLAGIVPALMGKNPLLTGLIPLAKGIAPFAFLFFCFLGVLAYWKGRKKVSLVERPDVSGSCQKSESQPAEDIRFNSHVGVPPEGWTFAPVEEGTPEEWSLDVLTCLEWKRFETVCTEYLRMAGHDATETRIGPDGGVDIVIHKEGQEKPVAIVQCKAWNSYKVGVKPVRELFGLMASERVTTGMFITSGDFTSEAIDFAHGKRLRLITGEKLLAAIQKLPAEKQDRLLMLALEGDYVTPTCPSCGVKMKLRTGRKGKISGNKFWGCVNYPKCRSTLVYKDPIL